MQKFYLYVNMAMSHLKSESSWFKYKLIKSFTEGLLGVVLEIACRWAIEKTRRFPLVLVNLLRQRRLQLQLQLLHASHSLVVSGCGDPGWTHPLPSLLVSRIQAGSYDVFSTPHQLHTCQICSGVPTRVSRSHCNRQPHLMFFGLYMVPKSWTAWLLIRVQKLSKEMFWPLWTSICWRTLSIPVSLSATYNREPKLRLLLPVLQGRKLTVLCRCAAVLLPKPSVMWSVSSHLGHSRQLLRKQTLELGVA